ncbi:MAG: hypothetical protein ACYCO5_01015 [Acidobacteriaceae bacterium]
MQRVNEFVFYELAIKIHSLADLTDAPLKYSENWLLFWNARQSIDEIYNQRPLNFTTPAALRLYKAITDGVPQKWEDVMAKFPRADDTEEPITPWSITEVREAAKEFETVLRTECQMMDTYFVFKKGVYSTKDLVENAHHQVPEPSRSSLPDQTKADFDQAGRCLAFDVPTAAAFHLLRGTESVIREYYELVVPGPKRASTRMRSWGVYINLMEKYKADANILSLLNHMKDVYRNPVLHPEENYSDERAQVLFGLCISAVVLLLQAIQTATAKGGNLNFPLTS